MGIHKQATETVELARTLRKEKRALPDGADLVTVAGAVKSATRFPDDTHMRKSRICNADYQAALFLKLVLWSPQFKFQE